MVYLQDEHRRKERYSRSSHHAEQTNSSREQMSIVDKNLISMVFCALLLLTVMAFKIFLPEKTDEISKTALSLIEEDFDYKGAVTAIGETLSGDENIIQVLGNLYEKAFKTEDDPSASVGTGESSEQVWVETPIEQLHKTASRIGSLRLSENIEENQETDAPSNETVEETDVKTIDEKADESTSADAAAEPTNSAVVEAFLLSQSEYSDYALPTNVSYDMPALNITYSSPIIGKVSSPFGYRNHPLEGKVKFHYGTDIAGDEGDSIAAFASGTVISVADSTASGLNVTIQHENNITTRYCHCSQIYVNEGDAVSMGDIIAAVGSTGNVTGPHLHIELKVSGMYVNPEYYLNFSYT